MAALDVVTGAFSYLGRYIAELGRDRLDDWLVANAATLGRSYQPELGKNLRDDA